MNDKITITRLGAMLALATGKQKELCENFLKELFSIVEDELLKGESIRIKGFGTFKLIEVEPRKSVNVATGEETLIPGHDKVIFVAAKELASRVNLPFEAFEAVEIADDLPTDSMDGDEDPEVELSEDSGNAVISPENADDVSEASGSVVTEADKSVERQGVCNLEERVGDSQIISEDNFSHSGDMPEEDTLSENDREAELSMPEGDVSETIEPGIEAEIFEENPHSHRNKYIKGFVAGFITALIVGGIVFAAGYLLGFSFGVSKGEDMAESISPVIIETEVIPQDSVSSEYLADSVTGNGSHDEIGKESGIDQVATEPSDKIVYDTVSTTRYLTTIAQEHYGNFNLWPVIYEENEKILGHPDRIRPGTRVVVPPLSKYGIDPKDKDQIKAVKEKGNKIYARYK